MAYTLNRERRVYTCDEFLTITAALNWATEVTNRDDRLTVSVDINLTNEIMNAMNDPIMRTYGVRVVVDMKQPE